MGGRGVGMSIAANKIPGKRAAKVSEVDTAVQRVEHNKANGLGLGTNKVNKGEAVKIGKSRRTA
jgi:Ribose 5-phosphate isomerase RpiB